MPTNKCLVQCAMAVAIAGSIAGYADADDISAGPNGINSRGLGLTGFGVHVGQVELGRPGMMRTDANGEWFWDQGTDNMANTNDADGTEGNGTHDAGEAFVDLDGDGAYTAGYLNAHPDIQNLVSVWTPNQAGNAMMAANGVPVLQGSVTGGAGGVTLNQYLTTPNVYRLDDPNIEDHATEVAGVMIANGNINKGVAINASLHSASFGLTGSSQGITVLATQQIAQQNGGTIAAINHSWGFGPLNAGPNGASLVSLGHDWVTTRFNTLQVIAGDELQNPASHPGAPSDAYNVLNVSALTDVSGSGVGVYDRYAGFNRRVPAPGGREIVHLAAPGVNILSTTIGGTRYSGVDGTSFAAPHVTGAVAQVRQFLNQQTNGPFPIGMGTYDATSFDHRLMKAVLMNSADKIKDDGTFMVNGNAVQQGFLLGMDKTILRDSAGTQTWITSPAFTNDLDPLDDNIGAGALNVERAITQTSFGRFRPGDIPLIGFDVNAVAGGNSRFYTFGPELLLESFVSITLVWDRPTTLNDTDNDNLFDIGESFTAGLLADLDIILWAFEEETMDFTRQVASSISSVNNEEHIFAQLDQTTNYRLEVNAAGGAANTTYALAWWAVPTPGTGVLLIVAGLFGARRRRAA